MSLPSKSISFKYNTSFSIFCFWIAAIFLFVASYHMGAYKVFQTITWDVVGYYMYLPSLFYDSINNPKNVNYIMENYHPMSEWYGTVKVENGNQVMRYMAGQAIMYLPAFSVAHFWAKISNYAVDGFSYPYQFCLNWWSTFIAVLGLYFSRKNLLFYFNEYATGLAILAIPFATNFVSYSTWSGPMTHSYLFTLYSILIFVSINFWKRESMFKILITGIVCGLISLTRITDTWCLIIPFFWGLILNKEILSQIFTRIFSVKGVVVLTIWICVLSIQFFYWKIVSEHWYVKLYWDEYLDFLHPHVIKALFSYERGWLVYSPIFVFAIMGLPFLVVKKNEFSLCVVLFLILNFWTVVSWSKWNYGGGYGHRAMIQSYAIWIFPLAFSFQLLMRIVATRILLWLTVVTLSWVNCGMALGKFLPANNITKEYFWKVWGKWSAPE